MIRSYSACLLANLSRMEARKEGRKVKYSMDGIHYSALCENLKTTSL
jgi:hypothetical protein